MIEELGWSAALAAAGVTLLVQWLLQPVAPRLKLLDYPKGRKAHLEPTPITGGIAMVTGVALVCVMAGNAMDSSLAAFLSASTLLVVVGLLDDRFDLPWTVRIPAQAGAALIMIFVGDVRVEQLGSAFGLEAMSLGWASIPFTVFATLGIINAINMVDGVDGLAGSIVLTALGLLGAAAIYAGNAPVANLALVLMGAVIAFLVYNMRFPWRQKAKLFMGNAGSAFLGFVIAWLAFKLTQNPGHPINPVLALWCVAVPVMDTLVLMIRRVRNKQSPFVGDRNHIHHLMLEAGFGPTQIAVMLSFVTGFCTLLVGQAMRLDIPNPVLLALFFLVCCGWYVVTIRRARAVTILRTVFEITSRPVGREKVIGPSPNTTGAFQDAGRRSA